MKRFFCIITILLFNCQMITDSENNPIEILGLFSRISKLRLSGKAIKGPYKNAQVRVFPLSLDGKCDTSRILASDFTDQSGDYQVSFDKTDGLVCVQVNASPRGNSLLYDEKLGRDIPVSTENDLTLVNIVPEYSFTGRRLSLGVTPISRMLLGRMEALAAGNTDPQALARAYRSASKEMVIRFNLNRRSSTRSISDSGVPSLEELNINWNDPKDESTLQFLTVLAGFSQLANDFKKGNIVTPKDVEALVESFAADAKDGKFDGKQGDVPVKLPNGEEMGENPLTNRLGKAIQKFISEGGVIGTNSESPVVVPSSLVSEIIGFQDATPILNSESGNTTTPNPVAPPAPSVFVTLFQRIAVRMNHKVSLIFPWC